ncbi:MAG: glycosyltransferase [Bacteroidota bacterium]|nr:glycosyltransferase [Kiloniellaceae bacterium]
MASPESAAETAVSAAAPPSLSGCVAFFGHDWQESTVVKRIRAFSGLGLRVVGFNFRRDKFARDFRPFWQNVHLGTTQDRAYGKRLLALLGALPKLLRYRRLLREADFFYARNIDMCALALAGRLIAGSRAPLVYEVLDVQRVFLGGGIVSRLFRWAERQLLRRSDLLVISSPGFDRHYFRSIQGYRGRLFLLENKISFAQAKAVSRPTTEAAAQAAQRLGRDNKWVIGWFGTLRCPKSLDMLCRIADALPDEVEIYLRGVPTETGLEAFERAIAGRPNMIYGGEYRNPDDLAEIYGRVHLTWAFDFLDEGSNSDWLLPNRLYEGGYFGSVALASSHTETGAKVRELGLGHTFGPSEVENLVAFLRRYTMERHLARQAHILALPLHAFCDLHDTRDLCALVLDLPRQPRREGRASLPARAVQRGGS